jgi:hypothetical protein
MRGNRRRNIRSARGNAKNLIIVAGHAIYIGKDPRSAHSDESWILQDFQKAEPPLYIEHIRYGVELAASRPESLLVFSGGRTSPGAGLTSEALGYRRLAEHFDWWRVPAIRDSCALEEYARDSYENLLFGIARFREFVGHYPASLDIVGWKFKRERFDLHREAIKWPLSGGRYAYHGVNDPDNLDQSLAGEAETIAQFRSDPFGTEEPLRGKRERRDPFLRGSPYASTCPEIADLLKHRTMGGIAFDGELPW